MCGSLHWGLFSRNQWGTRSRPRSKLSGPSIEDGSIRVDRSWLGTSKYRRDPRAWLDPATRCRVQTVQISRGRPVLVPLINDIEDRAGAGLGRRWPTFLAKAHVGLCQRIAIPEVSPLLTLLENGDEPVRHSPRAMARTSQSIFGRNFAKPQITIL